jgi:K+-sensing histidine kinase KdpD
MRAAFFRRSSVSSWGYSVAVGATLGALLIRLTLDRWLTDEAPLLPFVLAVILVAWWKGFRPGLLTTLLSGPLSAHLFIEPRSGGWTDSPSKFLWLLVFLALGAAVSWLAESLRGERDRSEALLASVLDSVIDGIVGIN